MWITAVGDALETKGCGCYGSLQKKFKNRANASIKSTLSHTFWLERAIVVQTVCIWFGDFDKLTQLFHLFLIARW